MLGFLAPAVVAVVWGTLLAPRRRIDWPKPARFALELAVFAVAALGLWATGQETLAIVLAAVALVSGILNYLWGDA